MSRVAIVIAGCGHRDGAEITETVLTALALGSRDIEIQWFAPNIRQLMVIDHLSGETLAETRNVLTEAARIARGKIKDVVEYQASDFDGLVFPGGSGAARNLFTIKRDGVDCVINSDVRRSIISTNQMGKPLAAIGISAALLAITLAREGKRPIVTMARHADKAAIIEQAGAMHQDCDVTDIVADGKNLLVTTPAYLYRDSSIALIMKGIDKAMETLASWI